MNEFFKSLWWFVDQALYYYWYHPRQFYRVGWKLRRHPHRDQIILSDYCVISGTGLAFDKRSKEEATQTVLEYRKFLLRQQMYKVGVFVERWYTNCEVFSLAKTGDFDRYQITSRGKLRRWK